MSRGFKLAIDFGYFDCYVFFLQNLFIWALPIVGGSKHLPGWFGALILRGIAQASHGPPNSSARPARKKVPQGARLSSESLTAIWAMPK